MARTELEKCLANIERSVEALPKAAEAFFINATPIRTGNARRNTELKGKNIEANYHYAGVLESGKSKQAPNGMFEPTCEYLGQYVCEMIKGRTR